MKQIKCYCGHTTYCDCSPLEEQSAVEWFQDQIIAIVNGTCELSETQIFEKAKAMESKQKGYSEEDVRLAYFQGEKDSYIKGGQTKEMENEFIQFLQQTKLNKTK